MKKILITGISGFVGRYYVDYLLKCPGNIEIHGISRSPPAGFASPGNLPEGKTVVLHQADVTDTVRIQSIITGTRPDQILHLAAQSSVAESWNAPASSFMNNITGFMNILEAVRKSKGTPRILSVGSSEQYGRVSETDLPVSEDHIMNPSSPYAAARVAQEQLAMVYHNGYGLDICCTRSFNHCGPGQADRFVASSIARQFADIRHGDQDPVIRIGNGSVVRDFLDVRDVVAAYALLLDKGISGDVYNICSGKGYAIRDIVSLIAEKRRQTVRIVEETRNMRPQDNPCIVGDNTKMRAAAGWQPVIPFEECLDQMVTFWETHR